MLGKALQGVARQGNIDWPDVSGYQFFTDETINQYFSGMAWQGMASPCNARHGSAKYRLTCRKASQFFKIINTRKTMNEARKYPLWREFVESENIDFGSSWSVEQLGKQLECDPTSIEFQFAIDSIRRAIRKHGMYLSSAGSNGLIYRVVEAHQNADVMARMQRRAIRSMRASVELGANTPRELLDAEQQRRHEAILERASTRLALINRSGKLLT